MNKWLKKYQPTIQTIGILLILIALIVSIKQNKIYQSEVETDKAIKAEENNPSFETRIKYNHPDILSDKFIFNSVKSKHILQKEEIIILDNLDITVLENYGYEFKSRPLKNELVKTIRNLFDCNSSLYEPMLSSYPIVIKYYYEDNGTLKHKTKLYKYIFKAYFSSSKCKLKSIGLEFIRDIDVNENVKDILFSYNVENCLLSTTPNFRQNLKEKLIIEDSILFPLYELADLNVQFIKHVFIIKGDSLERGVEYYYPLSMWADKEAKQKEELLTKIISNSDNTSKDLWDSFMKVRETEEIYKHLSSKSDVDSIKPFTIKLLYQSEFKQWNQVNKEFKETILNKVKIN